MFDMIGKQFFSALAEAIERRLGRDHPCFTAVDRVANDAGATAEAQAALAALDPDMAERLMADAHTALRERPASILGAWRGTGLRH